MTDLMSREIRLASRPKGLPTAANFTMAQTKLQPLQDQEVLANVAPPRPSQPGGGKHPAPPPEGRQHGDQRQRQIVRRGTALSGGKSRRMGLLNMRERVEIGRRQVHDCVARIGPEGRTSPR